MSFQQRTQIKSAGVRILTWGLLIFVLESPGLAESKKTDEVRHPPKDISALFGKYCAACHHEQHRGNKEYDVLDMDSLLKKSPSAQILKRHSDAKGYIVPGKPEQSLVLIRLGKKEMPPEGKPAPDEKAIKLLTQWIKAGAPAEKTTRK